LTIGHLEALIMDRLLEAQIVMKHSSVRGVRPGRPTTFWPEGTQDSQERWHAVLAKLLAGVKLDDPLRSRPAPPSAAAISRMEETWEWMAGIQNEDARKAVAVKVASWVFKVNSTAIARGMGIDRKTLNRRFNRGIEELMVNLCKKDVLPDEADEDLVSRLRPVSAIKNRRIGANAA
jgi:hypothetical protein